MTSLVQTVALCVSAALLLLVLELIRRRRLSEEYSFIWILFAVALLVLTASRDRIDRLALWLGIYYPPALLILVLIFFVFVASLYFSVVISRQRQQIERLIEDVAILASLQRERDRQARSSDPPSADVTTPPGA